MLYKQTGRRIDRQTTVLACIIFVYYITMYYVDNQVIFQAAYYRLDYLFRGNIMDFLFGWDNIVPYSASSQFLFTLWVFPVKLLNLVFTGSLESSIGAYLWYKLFIALCFMLVVKETRKIAITLGMDETMARWAVLFLSSSLIVVLPVFHIAQIDAVYMPIMLYGVRKYIEGDYKSFIIAFAVANPVKWLSVFIYIPLILFKEKRIPYIFRDVIAGFVFAPVEFAIKNMTGILWRIGILSADSVKVPYRLANAQIRALLFNTFKGPDGVDASLVVVAYGIVCILAFYYHYEGEKRGEMSIWLSFSSFAVLFAFGSMNCYWIILLVPFMVLLLFMGVHNIKINFILEALIPISFVGGYVITQSEVYGGRSTFDYLLFSLNGYLVQRRSSHSNNDMIHFIKGTFEYPGEYERVLPAIAVVCTMAFAGINFPYLKHGTRDEIQGCMEKTVYYWCWLRIIILVIWFLMSFYCLYK